MSKITLNPAGMSLGRHQRALKRRLQRMTKILQSCSPLDVFPASTKTFNFIAFGFSLMLEGHFYTLNDGFTLLQPQQNWEASSNPKKCGCEFWIWLFFPIQPYFRCSDSNRAPVTVWVVAFAIFVWCEMSLPFCAFCNVYRLCQTHRPPPQLRRHRDRSALLPWWRANNPKKSPLSPPPHPPLGTHQKTLSKHSSLCQRGPRAPPSPCQLSRSTQSEAHLPPAPQRASMPSPPCPGPRASGSPSVITLHHLAGRAQGRPWGSSRGLRPAPAGRVASSLTTPPTPTAKRRAAERTAVSLMSSPGLQIGALLHQAKYSLVT